MDGDDVDFGCEGDVGDSVFHAPLVGNNWKWILTFPAAIMSFVLVLMLIPDVADRVKKYSTARSNLAPEQVESYQDHDHDEESH